MRRRTRDIQADLFGGVTTLMPPKVREHRKLYTAVLYHRIYRGVPCWRAGEGVHVVGGRQVNSQRLVAMCPAMSESVLYRLGMIARPADYPPP